MTGLLDKILGFFLDCLGINLGSDSRARSAIRNEIRDVLLEAQRIIDSTDYPSRVRTILDALSDRIPLLPGKDRPLVDAAFESLKDLRDSAAGSYTAMGTQEEFDRTKPPRDRTEVVVGLAIEYLTKKVRS